MGWPLFAQGKWGLHDAKLQEGRLGLTGCQSHSTHPQQRIHQAAAGFSRLHRLQQVYRKIGCSMGWPDGVVTAVPLEVRLAQQGSIDQETYIA